MHGTFVLIRVEQGSGCCLVLLPKMVRRVVSEHRDDIREEQCWASMVRKAVATTREVASARVRSGAGVTCAEIQTWGGDVAKGLQEIALAVEAAETKTDSSERALAFADIVEAQLDAIAHCKRA